MYFKSFEEFVNENKINEGADPVDSYILSKKPKDATIVQITDKIAMFTIIDLIRKTKPDIKVYQGRSAGYQDGSLHFIGKDADKFIKLLRSKKLIHNEKD